MNCVKEGLTSSDQLKLLTSCIHHESTLFIINSFVSYQISEFTDDVDESHINDENDCFVLDFIEAQRYNRLHLIFRDVESAGIKHGIPVIRKVNYVDGAFAGIVLPFDYDIACAAIECVRKTPKYGCLLIKAISEVMIAKRKYLKLNPSDDRLRYALNTCDRLLRRLIQIMKERSMELKMDISESDEHTKAILEKLLFMKIFPESYLTCVIRKLPPEYGPREVDDWRVAYVIANKAKLDADFRQKYSVQLRKWIEDFTGSGLWGCMIGVKYCELLLELITKFDYEQCLEASDKMFE